MKEAHGIMWTYEDFRLGAPPANTSSRARLAFAWRETGDAYIIEGTLPGFRRKDLAIEAKGREVEVRAERQVGLFRPERRSLRHAFVLPDGADPTNIEARFEGEKLWLRISKLPGARRRTIPIRVNGKLAPPVVDAAALAPSSFVDKAARALRELGESVRSLLGLPNTA